MIVIEKNVADEQGHAVVRLDFGELLALSNALGEVLELIPEWEFHIRTGVERSEAALLHEQVRRLLRA
jgi:hypothetical protein